MKSTTLWLATCAVFLTLVSCAPKPAFVDKPVLIDSPNQMTQAAAKMGWEQDWNKTLAAAKKEGSVVIFGGSTAAALKLRATKLIQEKFGFNLEIVTSGGSELIPKILTERKNGLYVSDIYASGAGEIYDPLKPAGATDQLEPVLILPEVIDTRLWFNSKLPWGDKEHKVFIWAGYPNPQIAINTNLVKHGEINSYYDLLDPKWKGKIVVNDPTIPSGSAFTDFNALLYNKIVEPDFIRQLAVQQQMSMLRDQQLQIVWLAQGKFPVALWPSTGRTAEYMKSGAPIEWVITKEGVHLSGGGTGLALMNKAPHPNAAKIFLNWFLSKEGQTLIQNAVDKQSMRIDVPNDSVDPSKVRVPGIKYFTDPNIIESFVLQENDRYLATAKEIFDPLKK